MPRRGAVRTIGAALALVLFSGSRPGQAFGRTGRRGECPPGTKECSVPVPQFGPGGKHVGGCYDPKTHKCCTGPNLEKPPKPMSWVCGQRDGCGNAGVCVRACPQGTFSCGRACCPKGQVCYQGRCLEACPRNTTKCGKNCCKPKQKCQNGKCCDTCGGNGTCCNPESEYCCREPGDPNSPGRCCKKDKESCCGVGPEGAQKRMCCPKPNKCVRQLPTGIGGLTRSSPWVCCPPDRQVPEDERSSAIVACCDPSQVSLGGKLVVGPGIQGSCCDRGRICGSGASLTCCPTGTTCVGGACT